jgi:hypothetical protein
MDALFCLYFLAWLPYIVAQITCQEVNLRMSNITSHIDYNGTTDFYTISHWSYISYKGSPDVSIGTIYNCDEFGADCICEYRGGAGFGCTSLRRGYVSYRLGSQEQAIFTNEMPACRYNFVYEMVLPSISPTPSESPSPSITGTHTKTGTGTATPTETPLTICQRASVYLYGTTTYADAYGTSQYYTLNHGSSIYHIFSPSDLLIGTLSSCVVSGSDCICTYNQGSTISCGSRIGYITYRMGTVTSTSFTIQNPVCTYYFLVTMNIPPTPSFSITPSYTPTNTQTSSKSQSQTPSASESPSQSPSGTKSSSASVSKTASPSPSQTRSSSVSGSRTSSRTQTPSHSRTRSVSQTCTSSGSGSPSYSGTASTSETPLSYATAWSTVTPTVKETPSETPLMMITMWPSPFSPAITPSEQFIRIPYSRAPIPLTKEEEELRIAKEADDEKTASANAMAGTAVSIAGVAAIVALSSQLANRMRQSQQDDQQQDDDSQRRRRIRSPSTDDNDDNDTPTRQVRIEYDEDADSVIESNISRQLDRDENHRVVADDSVVIQNVRIDEYIFDISGTRLRNNYDISGLILDLSK